MVKTQIKRYEHTLAGGNLEEAQAQFKLLTKKLDKVSSTITIHKNTASRLKSLMSLRLNAMKAKFN